LEELEMFELLLSVSGIGPKSAQGILAVADSDRIKESIVHEDSSLLTKVSGVGKKTAERVVLELKSKIGRLGYEVAPGSVASSEVEEIDALVALGYSQEQARQALRKVDAGIKDSSGRIKEALRQMG
jgi:Holliday junction DNA helicase RuvA